VLILLEQHQIAIDEGGRITSKVRKVFRVANEDALEEWASVEQEFQPWHESKPELRARVIGTDGTVHWLEPKTIADSPAEEFDQSIFSDRRVIRAPLPAVAVGAVVEYEITVRESALFWTQAKPDESLFMMPCLFRDSGSPYRRRRTFRCRLSAIDP